MRVERTVCLKDCNDACALSVTVSEDEKILAVSGDPDHPTTRGYICEKVRHMPELLNSPDRLLRPMIRTGPKGVGQFRPASWDEAISLIARRWQEIIASRGAEAILPHSYFGSEGVINARGFDRRFFHALGATKLDRTICAMAATRAYQYTLGAPRGADPEHSEGVRLYILWGANIMASNIHQVPLLQAARRQGCRVVLIDPVPGHNAALADWVVTPRPGTDAALALGLMHVICAEQRYDREYVARHTLGFERLADRVAAYTPDRVAAITGVPAAEIVALARAYAATQPSLIRVGVGIAHHQDGDAAVRNIACLSGLAGAWAHPGGGITFVNFGWFPLNSAGLERADLAPPGVRTVNMAQLGQVLTAAVPPVFSLFVYCSNPAVTAPDQRRVLAGLEREDLFTVVHELVMTDTARYADVLLPACSQFEHEDLNTSPWHLYLQYNRKLVAPPGEAKPNTEVFRLLARALGLQEPSLYESDEALMRTALDHPDARAQGITLEELRRHGWMRVRPLSVTARAYEAGFATPSGKLEFYSQTMADQGLDPLPFRRTAAGRYPLHLIARASRFYTNSSLANLPALKRREQGRPTLLLNPADAADRRIENGDPVRVFNDQGECCLHAQVSDAVPPGVAATTGRWWLQDHAGGAGINSLTDESLSVIGQGPGFNSNWVEVEAQCGHR